MKGFIVRNINTLAQQPALLRESREERDNLTKMNSLLVEIIKKELGNGWDTVISDLTSIAKTDQNICLNNLKILKILSEEIFDFSKDSMTSTRIASLKAKFTDEFKQIYLLCDSVIKTYLSDNKAVSKNLIISCLQTLHAFLSWMPLYYIFMTDLIDVILIGLMETTEF